MNGYLKSAIMVLLIILSGCATTTKNDDQDQPLNAPVQPQVKGSQAAQSAATIISPITSF